MMEIERMWYLRDSKICSIETLRMIKFVSSSFLSQYFSKRNSQKETLKCSWFQIFNRILMILRFVNLIKFHMIDMFYCETEYRILNHKIR